MKELQVEKNVVCENFGNEEYGFFIYCDGWKAKEKIIVYSFGIGEDLSFSAQLAEKYKNVEIYAFDPTPKAVAFVEKYEKNIFTKFEFFPIGLSDKDFITNFYLPKNPQYVSGSEISNPNVDSDNVIKVQMHTLKYIMDMLGHKSIDLLKLDIEGSEFAAIPQILKTLPQGSIEEICVEVHNRFYSDGEERLKHTLDLLRKSGYSLAYISRTKEELTFIR